MAAKTKRSLLWLPLLALVVGTSVLSPALAQNSEPDPSEPIKNLQFQAADIQSVLTFLADYGNVNVVIAPGVKGTVTIKLKDVLWRTAMEIICRTYDLAVVEESDGYLRVLAAEEHRNEVTEREKHKMETQKLTPLETKIVKVANSTAADMALAVKGLLTDRGQVTGDIRSNSLIIQEIPDNLGRVMEFVAELDKPARQIKISSRLVEMFTTDKEEIGIAWKIIGQYTTETGRASSQTANAPNDRVASEAFSYDLQLLQNGWSVDALVEALVSNDLGKIVAHPEITTLDNKEARIQMGQKVPVKQFDEAGNVVVKFEEVGTILTVTPHLTAENQILMELQPERSTYQFDPNGVIINTSNAKTSVIVENGQTAVIGGLTTEDEVESEVGVPILKDIPIIGRIFKYTNKRTETRDLIIFVTPTIVESNLAMGG